MHDIAQNVYSQINKKSSENTYLVDKNNSIITGKVKQVLIL